MSNHRIVLVCGPHSNYTAAALRDELKSTIIDLSTWERTCFDDMLFAVKFATSSSVVRSCRPFFAYLRQTAEELVPAFSRLIDHYESYNHLYEQYDYGIRQWVEFVLPFALEHKPPTEWMLLAIQWRPADPRTRVICLLRVLGASDEMARLLVGDMSAEVIASAETSCHFVAPLDKLAFIPDKPLSIVPERIVCENEQEHETVRYFLAELGYDDKLILSQR
jgi:hypothetical protein